MLRVTWLLFVLSRVVVIFGVLRARARVVISVVLRARARIFASYFNRCSAQYAKYCTSLLRAAVAVHQAPAVPLRTRSQACSDESTPQIQLIQMKVSPQTSNTRIHSSSQASRIQRAQSSNSSYATNSQRIRTQLKARPRQIIRRTEIPDARECRCDRSTNKQSKQAPASKSANFQDETSPRLSDKHSTESGEQRSRRQGQSRSGERDSQGMVLGARGDDRGRSAVVRSGDGRGARGPVWMGSSVD